jgi:hypothetical protein
MSPGGSIAIAIYFIRVPLMVENFIYYLINLEFYCGHFEAISDE